MRTTLHLFSSHQVSCRASYSLTLIVKNSHEVRAAGKQYVPCNRIYKPTLTDDGDGYMRHIVISVSGTT